MKAIEFDEHTVKIAEHQEEYQTLPAYQGQDEYGPYLVFCFELDEAERKQVQETGRIYWKQITGGKPLQPIGMSCLKEHNLPVPSISNEYPVGVICPYEYMYKSWLKDNAKEAEEYVRISKIDHIEGRYFSRIEQGNCASNVDIDVREAAETRVKQQTK